MGVRAPYSGFQVEQVQRGSGAPYKGSGSMPGPTNGTPMCINFLDMEKTFNVKRIMKKVCLDINNLFEYD